ncbi:MAG: cytochrome c [Chitinophagaceae bacterium]|nr:cytochrome c [Chitinophagaceae bacterium]
MKQLLIIAGWAAMGVMVISCNRVRRDEGRAYMPDMAYSTAYETYAPAQERLKQSGAQYNGQPVAGTIARGEMAPYKLKNDSAGIIGSASVANPLPPLDAAQYLEAARLYLINCGICHGAKLDGNGPLYNGGNGPFLAAPRNLVTDPVITGMADGTMFHSITYGKNTMGSYSSQLTTEQRWMIVHYIREKQKTTTGGGPKPAADSTVKAVVDTVKKG